MINVQNPPDTNKQIGPKIAFCVNNLNATGNEYCIYFSSVLFSRLATHRIGIATSTNDLPALVPPCSDKALNSVSRGTEFKHARFLISRFKFPSGMCECMHGCLSWCVL